MKKGFTLIELLVVVLIIGILAAIALPMYQKAVLKSRFAALMPIAKAMADSNEAYYLEHGQYAVNPQELPVQGQLEYPTGTTLEFGSNMDYAYVLAHNPDARNNYIVYQKHSANYPGEIHCEALTGDELAESICAGFGNGNGIGTTLTDGYTTYVIDGIGAGLPAGADDNEMSCDKASAMGLTCNISQNEQGQTQKQVCSMVGNKKICRTKTYREDGSYFATTCEANDSNVCINKLYNEYYDNQGNQLAKSMDCNDVLNDGTCYWGLDYYYKAYDDQGHVTLETVCESVADDGSCNSYLGGGTFYTYDDNGNILSQRWCTSLTSNGECGGYDDWDNFDYEYDANGNLTKQRTCIDMYADGRCAEYEGDVFFTYDENGNRTSQKYCDEAGPNGTCNAYASGYVYTYDDTGKMTSQRSCNAFASNGDCSAYNQYRTDYKYDDNGNRTATLNCQTVATDGSCSSYPTWGNFYDTYDADGKRTSHRSCISVGTDGSCGQYSSSSEYIYDDNNNFLGRGYCSGSDINPTTGECISYSSVSMSK